MPHYPLTFSPSEIETIIPHRFENQILDKVCLDSPTSGSLDCRLSQTDPRGRALFLKNIDKNDPVITTPFLMETLAIACAVGGCQNQTKDVFYVGISNFERTHTPRITEAFQGTYQKVKEKRGFITCTAELTQNNRSICTGTMMAFFADKKPISKAEKKTEEQPKIQSLVNKTAYNKPLEMIISDACVSHAPNTCRYLYTYPKTHTLIRGHYPHYPIMMGVMQWLAIEDCLFDYVFNLGLATGRPTQIKGNCSIKNTYGHAICEIRECVVAVQYETENQCNSIDILSTKKVTFKGMVCPGDSLIIDIEHSAT